MKLDEAIAQFKEDAENNRADLDILFAEENEQIAAWLKELEQYRAIGTVEEITRKLAELDRWHISEVNPDIKNVFANVSTQICHNCDHKDEYIVELETEIEECRSALEKQKDDKELDLLLCHCQNKLAGNLDGIELELSRNGTEKAWKEVKNPQRKKMDRN